jgi:hypothetical protein
MREDEMKTLQNIHKKKKKLTQKEKLREDEKKKKIKPSTQRSLPFSWPSSAHKRPAAALSRQGFSSPKIDWVSQLTSGWAYLIIIRKAVVS